MKTSLPLISSQQKFLQTIFVDNYQSENTWTRRSRHEMLSCKLLSSFQTMQLNKQVRNIYSVIISSPQTQKIWLINQSRWLTDSLSCTISMTVNLCHLNFEAHPNKIPHKIWLNMSKKNQIKDFPQNIRKGNTIVIMNMGNSIVLDLYKI